MEKQMELRHEAELWLAGSFHDPIPISNLPFSSFKRSRNPASTHARFRSQLSRRRVNLSIGMPRPLIPVIFQAFASAGE